MLKGRCCCGAVRYEVDGTPRHSTGCHCSICRRTSAAPFVAWFTVEPASFRLVAGELTRFRSSAHATRTFCTRCGTPITFQSAHYPDEIDITTGSLDDPEQVPPKAHTYAASALSWVKLADGLPVYPDKRPEQC
ncbi:GFA family protein [Reyranella sp.]|uniref:GFA family protein n=1 Tax=Reyranella sp. TaxID=1929291 RepID=UPI003D09AF48